MSDRLGLYKYQELKRFSTKLKNRKLDRTQRREYIRSYNKISSTENVDEDLGAMAATFGGILGTFIGGGMVAIELGHLIHRQPVNLEATLVGAAIFTIAAGVAYRVFSPTSPKNIVEYYDLHNPTPPREREYSSYLH